MESNTADRIRLLLGTLVALWALMAGLPPIQASDPAGADPTGRLGQPVVVELFTSQACAMCPPADAFLAELANEPGVIALAYHVPLWNFLGWQDPLAKPEHMTRHRAYNTRLRGRGPYTPQMVIQGAHAKSGSRRRAVRRAIEDARGALAVPVEVGAIDDDNRVTIHVGAGSDQSAGQIVLLAYRHHHDVLVQGGENAGRTADHANVVFAHKVLAQWDGTPVTMEAGLPDDDGKPPHGIAVIVQTDQDGPILGAARVALDPHHDGNHQQRADERGAAHP